MKGRRPVHIIHTMPKEKRSVRRRGLHRVPARGTVTIVPTSHREVRCPGNAGGGRHGANTIEGGFACGATLRGRSRAPAWLRSYNNRADVT